jgi:hypothetical protein
MGTCSALHTSGANAKALHTSGANAKCSLQYMQPHPLPLCLQVDVVG